MVARNDRLGDALMALPSLLSLRMAYPELAIDFFCREAVLPALRSWLLKNQIEGITSWPQGGLRKAYNGILFLFSDTDLMYEAWREWIGVRVGIYSRPASFLLLNGGIIQHRSRAAKNEAEYNLDLTELFAKKLFGERKLTLPPKISLPENRWESERVAAWLGDAGVEGDFVVVHPGMGGSALNASVETYVRLVRSLLEAGRRVVLSQGPAPLDAELAATLTERISGLVRFFGLTLQETAELFRRSCLVVAPATGPLHLAHYVGVETLGIFSPVRAQHRDRWAPWGGTGKVNVLVPSVECPGLKACWGERCENYLCLDQLRPENLILPELPA
ncbi:MAG: glycosyltransferase family 9 protein [Deltaproteobacteria bacterium]|nr:glycosyltransferase family 9 protein [Deltaproteobacteria bacterium]MBI3295221.1 glycosyltransferase family 9 protein [Deltaproteobacteria bacterium]